MINSTTRLYMDFGAGWVDVSAYTSYQDLTITDRACSDTYHRAQNVASFKLIYNDVLFALIYAVTTDIKVKITRQNTSELYPSEYLFPGEDLFPYGTEEEVLFQGIVPPTASRTYNGVLDNTILRMEAIDASKYLDKDIGDILYENYYIMNPSNKSASIIHQLAYIAGLTDSDIDQTITISKQISYFSPNDEKDSILDVMDILLFENGYVFNINEEGKISPKKWIMDPSTEYVHLVDESVIVKSITVEEREKEFNAVDLMYYELGEKENTRLFTADLPYSDLGGFEGYPVIAGTYWPVEANATDRIIGGNKVIYQEYTDVGIKYKTNYAIANNLDYNYKAFDSDFTSIVATKDHVLEASIDTLTLISGTFYNKKARILYKNNTAVAQNIYYLGINGTVIFKKAQLVLRAGEDAASRNADKYETTFVYDSTAADSLAKGMLQMLTYGNEYYSFESEQRLAEGSLVRIYTNDGVDQTCFVLERSYNDATKIYTYKARGYAYNQGIFIGESRKVPTDSTLSASAALIGIGSTIVASSTYTGPAKYKCDGVNDDVEIQAAIDYLISAFGGGTVFLTNGNYVPGNTIVMKSGIILKGVGNNTILTPKDSSVVTMIDFDVATGSRIEDFCIYGNRNSINITTDNAKIIIGNSDCYASNIRVENYRFLSTSGPKTFSLFYALSCQNCVAYGNDATATFGNSVYFKVFDNGERAVSCSCLSNAISADNSFLYGFAYFNSVSSCDVSLTYISGDGSFLHAFDGCKNMSTCISNNNDAIGTQAFILSFYACDNISSCSSIDNSATGTNSYILSFNDCDNASSCTSQNNSVVSSGSIVTSFQACTRVVACNTLANTSTLSSEYGFYECKSVQQCKSSGDSNPYTTSYADSGTSYPCADTPNGGFNS